MLGNRHVKNSEDLLQLAKHKHEKVCSNKQNYIFYYDAISLYAWPMCMTLPTVEMSWDHDLTYTPSIDDICYPNQTKEVPDADIGYIYEVDLEYPADIHEAT